jgi:uncharacterized protein YegL
MKGEPIESVKVGLSTLVSSLRGDPHALDTVHLSLMTFDREVKVLVPLTSLEDFILPVIATPEAGPTMIGLALEQVCKSVEHEVEKSTHDQKGDWRPLLFVMTDGSASDVQLFNRMVNEVKKHGFGSVVGCAAGPKAKREELHKFCNHVVALDTMDGHSFQSFFQWVSTAIAGGNMSVGVTSQMELPPPPPDVRFIS